MTVPLATYRLQLHGGFTFEAAAATADYLAALGVTHAYCSPYLQAATGSTHGYDVVDHRSVNSELGGEEGLGRFVEALMAHGLGQVLDIVPNHVAIVPAENRWWRDVLENGPSSHFAAFFDVDWEPAEARLRNAILIPVLADQYGCVLERGELKLQRAGATFSVCYAEHRYPVDPRSLGLLLGRAARAARSDALAFIADAFSGLPRPTATDRTSVRRGHRDKQVLQRQLERCLEEETRTAVAIDAVVAEVNGNADALHDLWKRKTTAWRGGAVPAVTSGIDASSTSIPSSVCAWRTRRSSTRLMPV